MAENIQELLNEVVAEVIENIRYGDEKLATVIAVMEERLGSALKRIEDKIDSLSWRGS